MPDEYSESPVWPNRGQEVEGEPPDSGADYSGSRPLNRVGQFQRALAAYTPRVFVTPALIAVNVAILVAMVATKVSLFEPNTEDMLRWGANYGARTLGGQWWRLLTATFLHFGIIHLAFNMIVLGGVGTLVERLLGNVGFLVMYLVSGLLGSVASLLWNPYAVGAGASGAVFGVYGALLGFLVRQRHSVPVEVLAAYRNSTLAFLAYNVIYGLMAEGIDMAAHIGGLVAGFGCGLIQARPMTAGPRTDRAVRNLVVAVGGVTLAVLVVTLHPRVPDFIEEVHRFDATEKAVIAKVNAAGANAGKIGDQQLARVLEEAVGEWSATRERLAVFQGLPQRQQDYVNRLLLYMQTREQGWKLFIEALHEGNLEKAKLAQAKQQEADRIVQAINAAAKK
jgi:membrane associated rhomboid family serine protease